jgi:ParB-like chromosome segregation protein Spo0J
MSEPALTSAAPAMLGTTLGRARCPHPAALERMKRSLQQHGQLTPVVTVMRAGKLELVDGFKRRTAALALSFPELLCRVIELDETAQWVAMLQLNLSQSITVLEEALVLRELLRQGLTQVEIGTLVGRHKAWVSRRIGLVERLHPELLEQIKQGLLHPGVARRLLGLPAGNQLELAAVAMETHLGPEQMERLVSLWQRARDPEVRRYLMGHPQQALAQAYPKPTPTPCDPRLSPPSQTLVRLLGLMEDVTPRMLRLLRPPPPAPDLEILRSRLKIAQMLALELSTALGSCTSDDAAGAKGASAETS